MNSSHKFFSNKECEYYPCHKLEEQNCLFCFCPLYNEEECGENYLFLPNGLKDCSECLRPHTSEGYDYIIKKLTKNCYDN